MEVEEVILDQNRGDGVEREVDVEIRETAQPRNMMFGEIPPTSLTLPHSASGDEQPLMARKRKLGEGWEDGLFWYYRQPLLSFSPGSSSENGENEDEGEEGEEVVDEKVERSDRVCFAAVRKGLGILSRRMEALFSSRCLGRGMRGMRVGIKGFRALEG